METTSTSIIRTDVRECIIQDVNMTLRRLGVSVGLEPDGVNRRVLRDGEQEYYQYRTEAIAQQPVMFRELYIEGVMSINGKNEDGCVIVSVDLTWRWRQFSGGCNGATLGVILYNIAPELPKTLDNEKYGYTGHIYIQKEKSLTI